MPNGFTFTEMAPPSVTTGGQHVISLGAAVQAAEANFPLYNQPGVQVTASYGSYSNDEYLRVKPGGQREALFQNHPTWIVRFTGVNLYAVGGLYDRMHPDQWRADVHHESASAMQRPRVAPQAPSSP